MFQFNLRRIPRAIFGHDQRTIAKSGEIYANVSLRASRRRAAHSRSATVGFERDQCRRHRSQFDLSRNSTVTKAGVA